MDYQQGDARRMPPLQLALQELLDSERAYASDLALIRDVFMPLASGHEVSLHPGPSLIHVGNASPSSSPVFSASSVSSGSLVLTDQDIKIIFGNIPELAVFAHGFYERMEKALGQETQGIAAVSELFMNTAPELERLYQKYISRHCLAIERLQKIPSSPAYRKYLRKCRSITHSFSQAGDLAAFLIKPVQRLTRYPMLLGAVLKLIPGGHPHKASLTSAKNRMEEVTMNVNEGKRRVDVVRSVFQRKSITGNTRAIASGTLPSIKTTRRSSPVPFYDPYVPLQKDTEALQVDHLEKELRRMDDFCRDLVRDVLEWRRAVSHMVRYLQVWGKAFGRAVGSCPSPSHIRVRLKTLLDTIQKNILPRAGDLEPQLAQKVVAPLLRLAVTTNRPFELIESMKENEAQYCQLQAMAQSGQKLSKNASEQLVEATTNFFSLRAQLAVELPCFIELMDRGLCALVRRLADIQSAYWRDMAGQWAELCDSVLKIKFIVEKAGCEETTAIWRAQWLEAEEQLAFLVLINHGDEIFDSFPRGKRKETDLEVWMRIASEVNKSFSSSNSPLQDFYELPTRSRDSSATLDRLLMMTQLLDSELDDFLAAQEDDGFQTQEEEIARCLDVPGPAQSASTASSVALYSDTRSDCAVPSSTQRQDIPHANNDTPPSSTLTICASSGSQAPSRSLNLQDLTSEGPPRCGQLTVTDIAVYLSEVSLLPQNGQSCKGIMEGCDSPVRVSSALS